MRQLHQVRIIHLSDIHFGAKHICNPPDPTSGRTGIPLLEDLIIDDLSSAEWADSLWATPQTKRHMTPLFIAVTGDLTQRASHEEFARAHDFLSHMTSQKLLGTSVLGDQLFIVPGNHDVAFSERQAEVRFQSYCTFYNKIFRDLGAAKRKFVQPDESASLTQIHKRPESKFLVAEINSCQYVEKDTADESRGQVDYAAISRLRGELEAVKEESTEWIKVALVHHHPVLIPALVEPGRGYDSIVNAGSLLRLLRDHGFQLILHGHKHHPQVFSFDAESGWSAEQSAVPQLIVAGGSCGSSELPVGSGQANTYNVITVKWDSKALHARIQVITRGLQRLATDSHLDPDQWKWRTLRVSDRTLGPHHAIPAPSRFTRLVPPEENESNEQQRKDQYKLLRYNMPVVEVIPSLMPRQGYEARVWLERHHKDTASPVSVTWSAGPYFERKVCGSAEAPEFCVYFHYWGPMLIQAELVFEDGERAFGYVYARFPEQKAR